VAQALQYSEIVNAYATDPCSIVLELCRDCEAEIDTSNLALRSTIFVRDGQPSVLRPYECTLSPLALAPSSPLLFARTSAHFRRGDEIVFLLPEARVKFIDIAREPLFLAGDFNGWIGATKSQRYALKFTAIGEEPCFALSLPAAELPAGAQFKFVSAGGTWIGPEIDAPNGVYSGTNCNYFFDRSKTGRHLIHLSTGEPMVLANEFYLRVDGLHEHPIDTSPWLLKCYTNAELGARIRERETTFRVFMPRASAARVLIYADPSSKPRIVAMERQYDDTWTAKVDGNLHGQCYHYQALFRGNDDWNSASPIVDPYARATCSRSGPGVILRERTFLPLRDNFVTQPIGDDIIVEAHIRDLLKNAPIRLSDDQRMTFNGLRKWLRKKHCYLRRLGANAVEFQPITESDAEDRWEYFWGYMPVTSFRRPAPMPVRRTGPPRSSNSSSGRATGRDWP
jgi:hypothetical protein